MTRTVISQTDLQDRTCEIFERVRHGEMAVVESTGEEQIVLLDAADFRLLRALAACATDASELEEEISSDTRILRAYLADEISLGKAAEELGLSRFDLADRFHRLGIPLPFGPVSLEDARSEIAGMRKTRRVTSLDAWFKEAPDDAAGIARALGDYGTRQGNDPTVKVFIGRSARKEIRASRLS